jgi:hypothetical protein
MMKAQVRAAVEALERAAADYDDLRKYSRQDRFTEGTRKNVFGFIRSWVQTSIDEEPEYKANSMKRDVWLSHFAMMEPHWVSVLNQCILINSNRGWTLTGGRNQVARYGNILTWAEGGEGWRVYTRKGSRSFYTADMCMVSECGRDGVNGPLRALYHVDPKECQLTGDLDYPLKYNDQKWRESDFFRVVSMPSDEEKMNGLGFCATSRALELVRLLYAVLEHDQEKLGARMPKGLLLLKGISERQWRQALEMRKAQLDAESRAYFGGLMVLAGTGASSPEARLVSLSQLPDGFERKTFLDSVMYGYSLVVGMDPSEFWPVQYGALGRGNEELIQHQKATTKGAMDFAIGLQDRLQQEFPESIHFEFEQRDEEGDLLRAEVMQAWATVAKTFYTAGTEQGQEGGEPLLSRDQVISLLVQEAQLPAEWSDIIEDTMVTDKGTTRTARDRMRDEAMTLHSVRRAIELFPKEPIVRYSWPECRESVIWDSGEQAKRRSRWHGVDIERQDEGEVLYEDEDVTITEGDVTRSIDELGRRVDPEAAALAATEETWPVEEEERSLFRRALKALRGE